MSNRRHSHHFYEVLRDLETLRETPANRAQLAGMSDVLTTWARVMLDVNFSTAAPRLYRVICDAWEDNRLELYPGGRADSRDRRAVNFHTAFLLKFGKLGDHTQPSRADDSRALTACERDMRAVLARMSSRITLPFPPKMKAVYTGPLHLLTGRGGE